MKGETCSEKPYPWCVKLFAYLCHDSLCQGLVAILHDYVDELAVEREELILEPESEPEAVN